MHSSPNWVLWAAVAYWSWKPARAATAATAATSHTSKRQPAIFSKSLNDAELNNVDRSGAAGVALIVRHMGYRLSTRPPSPSRI
ncbi:uncharacterized protein LY79DRAFT_665022 [Colletotrichum navitas]|uniref:Secreted protein n=1 Tax=Colletotrichum navitas TaxID=681940 RepID=A0AAD8VBQ1_9PEZI|nr:uncharacterized protein LY79DRAFT_665022 [Colletotrichum navitas]KAK1599313.1 hypothetical protein LY79DRAFT_665022 [Colletotrichum navitas]